jgi:membrane protein
MNAGDRQGGRASRDAARAGRGDRLVARYPLELRGVSITLLVVRIAERFDAVRVMGLAAEMTYYALLSLLPLVGALGASLGFLERVIGPLEARQAEATILSVLDVVFSADVTADVIAPLVEGLLQEERTGFAITSFAVTLFFASRVFRSAIDTLDAAYAVDERRSTVALWSLGLLFALCAVLVAAILITMVVLGPLLGGGRALANWLGLGTAFELVWTLVRWPTVLIAATGFLSLLYHFGPNVRGSWRASLPGAVFGMAALVLVSLLFRVYIEATGLQSPQITDAEDAVQTALHFMGALMAALFWLWLSSMVLLTGGVVNAELARLRSRLPPRRV